MKNEELLKTLAECMAACNHCASSCLQEAEIGMMRECIRLDIDCAEFCSVTAGFVARNSDHARHLLRECAEMCEKCSEECGRHDNLHCQHCSDACRRCAEACREAAA